jgi:hypothetical protein
MSSVIPSELASSTIFRIGILLIALSGIIKYSTGLDSGGTIVAELAFSTVGLFLGGVALMRVPNGGKAFLFWVGLFAVSAASYRILTFSWHLISRMA